MLDSQANQELVIPCMSKNAKLIRKVSKVAANSLKIIIHLLYLLGLRLKLIILAFVI